MEKTIVSDWIGREAVGYWVGILFSPENQRKIAELADELKKELPGILWAPPADQQHITVFEVVMTLRDYPEDRDVIFERHRAAIDAELTAQLAKQPPIKIAIETIQVNPDTIILLGSDDGSIQKIRDAVASKHLLPEGTRTPPNIIHCSLARFAKEAELSKVRQIVSRHSVHFTETVRQFELVRIWRTPLEHETIKTYPLKG